MSRQHRWAFLSLRTGPQQRRGRPRHQEERREACRLRARTPRSQGTASRTILQAGEGCSHLRGPWTLGWLSQGCPCLGFHHRLETRRPPRARSLQQPERPLGTHLHAQLPAPPACPFPAGPEPALCPLPAGPEPAPCPCAYALCPASSWHSPMCPRLEGFLDTIQIPSEHTAVAGRLEGKALGPIRHSRGRQPASSPPTTPKSTASLLGRAQHAPPQGLDKDPGDPE